MHPDDAAVVARAKAGDEDAFRVLVDRHGRDVFRLAYRMTGQRQDAEDVVQETFVKAYRQLGRFEARSNFSTWLYRIAFNCAIDFMRARPHRESTETPLALVELASASRQPATDDLIYAREIGAKVQGAMTDLSAQERAAFLMRHFYGCSISEICGALDIGTNAAKHAVFRAVRKMRHALEPIASSHPITEVMADERT